MMRILMVNKFLYPKGGAETYMFKLGEYLQSLGHQVEYFGMEHPERCVKNSAEIYTDCIDFRNAKATEKILYSFKSIYSSEAAKKIGTVIKNFKPDIVHLNNINFQLTPSIIYEIKKHKIPIVQTVHDVQIACPNHRMYIEHQERICTDCIDGKYFNCIKNKCIHSSALKSVLACAESYYYHKRNTYNLIDRYICPSRFVADAIISGGVKQDKITVLHNYCEEPKHSYDDEENEKYVLYFGRLSVEKGIKTLLECARELHQIKFVLAGCGPLEEICANTENVKSLGFVSGDELKSLIANAAFTLCPSEWYENCPMSVVESLALGTPVICSDLGGTKELVKENETGLIFEAKNKEQLKQKILTLYNDDALLHKMSQVCLKSSTNTIENYSDTLIEIYKNLIKNNER